MPGRVSRRQLLSGLTVTAVAFDPIARRWLSRAAAQAPVLELPPFDGELVLEPDALAEAADDFGHTVHHVPWAVLRPGSIEDIQRAVRFAYEHDLVVAMRGQGHSTYGQAQAEAGLVIDSRSLDTIDDIQEESVWVDAGVRWIDLLTATLTQGLTPPVLTDYLGLSIGGTLSVGGIGGATARVGFQVDHVHALTVVTGCGELVTCSRHTQRALFEAVLAGLGQCALIVRAKLALAAAPSGARVYRLYYDDAGQFTRDQAQLASDERFDYLEGQLLPQATGSFQFMIEAAAYYTPPATLDDAALLTGLTFDPARTVIEEVSYFDWSNRLAPTVEALQAAGLWDVPHAFFDVFVPSENTLQFLNDLLPELTPAATGGGPLLVYPFARRHARRPLLALPSSELVFIVSVLRFAPDPSVVAEQIAGNRRWFEAAQALGAKRYAIGSIPFDFADWLDHFGRRFASLALRKARFDPRGVLTPGQGIF
ncbi:MAG: FAD-binding protein [Polyangiales bacterium]